MRILIIEDDHEICESLQHILETRGHVVQASPNGYVALEFLHSVKVLPALILLDIAMPMMNGFEFRERQLQEEAVCNIPVICLSGMHWTDWMKDKLGCDGYLTKPLKWDVLEEHLSRFVVEGK